MAATYSGHTIVGGLGQLGGILCTGLTEGGALVVGIDLDEHRPAVVTARRQGIPVIVGDMTLRETLMEADIGQAFCVVMCSGDDLANIEAAIMAKELNPAATVYTRVFKKSLADRINEALHHNIITFSPYAAAAETILGEIRINEGRGW